MHTYNTLKERINAFQIELRSAISIITIRDAKNTLSILHSVWGIK